MASECNTANKKTSDMADIVERLFRSWTGYQFALKMQMGGAETMEKAKWFEQVLLEHLHEKCFKNGTTDSLADWIEELIFNEFDLILEDGSVEWICDSIFTCRKFLKNGNYQNLTTFLARLPSDSAVRSATELSSKSGVEDDEESDSGSSSTGDLHEAEQSVVQVEDKDMIKSGLKVFSGQNSDRIGIISGENGPISGQMGLNFLEKPVNNNNNNNEFVVAMSTAEEVERDNLDKNDDNWITVCAKKKGGARK